MENYNISIIGLGWLGQPLAKSLKYEGYNILGSTTRDSKLAELNAEGIKTFILNLPIINSEAKILMDSDVIFLNFPPKIKTEPDIFIKKIESLTNELSKIKRKQLLIFVSSTSVYGKSQGEVSEDSDPIPSTKSGKTLLEAENFLLDQFQKFPQKVLSIFRPSGLVGFDRIPINFFPLNENNEIEITDPVAPVNFVHREDIIEFTKSLIKFHRNSQPIPQIVNLSFPDLGIKRPFYEKLGNRFQDKKINFLETPDSSSKRVLSSAELYFNFKYQHSPLKL